MNSIDGEPKSQMIPLWNKSFSAFCLGLLVMFAGNIVLVGCSEPAKNSEPVEESEQKSNQVNQADDDDDEGHETTGSSDKDDDEEKDGEDKD
ncbi:MULTISPECIES: hypothetical protein [Cyanophyceae]|uniref:hypothetical protein n=1 Tax=Cyanophyceae TaxID=3028117 RepID=UPI001685C4D1|nr:hypothetical protein [Trichocoleus sp. FACHB-69]MBD1932037.1 hypothetical protein [Trichocoleus sp. FACHB-69]